MTGSTETSSNTRQQYLALAILSLGAAVCTGIVSLSHATFFQPYFGSIPPLLAITLITTVGFVSLGFLHSRGWFEIYTRKKSLRGAALAAALATLFVVPTILVDLNHGFPRDLNVPAPQSLLFYPAMAYVVEIALHALPLSLLLASLGAFRKANTNRLVWLGIVAAAFLEPIIQLRLGYSNKPVSWPEVYVAVHVFTFNLVEMYIFRRYDFVSMCSFRLVYYIHWHILWGHLRLQWLF